jgi:hypothetical protein
VIESERLTMADERESVLLKYMASRQQPCDIYDQREKSDASWYLAWHRAIDLACGGLSPLLLGNGIDQRWGTLFDQRRTGSHAETLHPCAARATPAVTMLVRSEVELKEAGPQSPLCHSSKFLIRS